VIASRDGRSFVRTLDVRSGQDVDLGNIALDAPAIINGVVQSEAGEPVPGAVIRWQPTDPYNRDVFVEDFWEGERAGDDGTFATPVWTHGIVQIAARGGPFVDVPGAPLRDARGNLTTLNLQPGGAAVTLVIPNRPGRGSRR
jgi:hypothetical protein